MDISATVLIPCTIPGDIGAGTLKKKAVDFARQSLRLDLALILSGDNLLSARADLDSGSNVFYQVHGLEGNKNVLGPVTAFYQDALNQAKAHSRVSEDHPVTIYLAIPREHKPDGWVELPFSNGSDLPPVIIDRVSYERHFEPNLTSVWN